MDGEGHLGAPGQLAQALLGLLRIERHRSLLQKHPHYQTTGALSSSTV